MSSKIFLSGLALCVLASVSSGMEVKECIICFSTLPEKPEGHVCTLIPLTEKQKGWCIKSNNAKRLIVKSKIAERTCGTGFVYRSPHNNGVDDLLAGINAEIERESGEGSEID